MGFLAVFENMVLFPCQDPRGRSFPTGGISPMIGSDPILQDATELIEEGHYMLYQFGNANFVT